MTEWPTHRRIPRIRRLEYLVEFLDSAKQGYNHDTAKKRILDVMLKFTEEKNKALGKVRKPKMVKGEELVVNSKQLAVQLQLMTKNNLALTSDGKKMLELGIENPEIRKVLTERIWRTYLSFEEVLLKVREQGDGEFVLPVERKKDVFSKVAKEQYTLTVDQLGFEVVRDWGTQLRILNWKLDVENKMQSVYLITTFAKLSEMRETNLGQENQFKDLCISTCKKELKVSSSSSIENILSEAEEKDFAVIRVDQDYVFFRNFRVTEQDFEQAIWEEYMKLTNYKARFPILYPKLRDNVCRRLRISDKVFDRFALRITGMREKYSTKIYPAGGTLPYHPNISRMLKNLPPKTGGGNFIMYLKLDR